MQSFGNRLKQLRKSKQLTQQDLANLMGLSRATIAGYEASGKQPDQEKTLWLAYYFNVSTDYLLGKTDQRGVGSIDEKLADAIANKITILRKKENLDSLELSHKLGFFDNIIAQIEAGDFIPDIELTSVIADYFKVPIDYLLGRTDDPFPGRSVKTLDEFFEGRNSPADQELKIVLAAEGSGMFSNYERMSEEEKMIIVNFFKAQQALKEKEEKEGN